MHYIFLITIGQGKHFIHMTTLPRDKYLTNKCKPIIACSLGSTNSMLDGANKRWTHGYPWLRTDLYQYN